MEKNYCKVCGKECWDTVHNCAVDTCSSECHYKELEYTVLESEDTQYQFTHYWNRCSIAVMNLTAKTKEDLEMENVTARQIKFALLNSGWEQV